MILPPQGGSHALDLTTVYVTHDHADAAALADLVDMCAGRVLAVQDSHRRQDPA
jgi:hypothetical protein